MQIHYKLDVYREIFKQIYREIDIKINRYYIEIYSYMQMSIYRVCNIHIYAEIHGYIYWQKPKDRLLISIYRERLFILNN